MDKRPFRVTRNLFDAMMDLRESETMIIWIDAICINQKDDEEKAWQVRLMGDLYQKASKVLAWLRAPADDSDAVIDYLNTLRKQAEACGLDHSAQAAMLIWPAITTMPSYMDDPAKIVVSGWYDGHILRVSKSALERLLHNISGRELQDQLHPTAGLFRIFRRAWWERVWVIQEITLQNDADFACGTKRMFRRRLRAAFNAFYALWYTMSITTATTTTHYYCL